MVKVISYAHSKIVFILAIGVLALVILANASAHFVYGYSDWLSSY